MPASISVDERVVDHRLVVDRQQLLADHGVSGWSRVPDAAGEMIPFSIIARSLARPSRSRAVSCRRARAAHQSWFSRYQAHRRAQARRRRTCAGASRARARSCRVDRVAPIVPGPVGDEADQRSAYGARPRAAPAVEQRADASRRSRDSSARRGRRCCTSRRARRAQHAARAPRSGRRRRASRARSRRRRRRAAVARRCALRIIERDQLLRELVRPVVVRAIGDDRRQAVGVEPRAHEVIGRRLARGVRRIAERRASSSAKRRSAPSEPNTSSVDTWRKRNARARSGVELAQ